MARRNDHTREQIRDMALLAAENIIRSQGLSKLSTRKVAKKINYTVGTIYLVFTNISDLILQINSRTLEDLYCQLIKQIDRPNSKMSEIKKVYVLAQTYLQFAKQNFHRWNALFSCTINGDSVQGYQHKVDRMFSLLEKLLAGIYLTKSKQEIQIATRALWCGVHGICVLTLSKNPNIVNEDSQESLVDNMVGNYLKGFE